MLVHLDSAILRKSVRPGDPTPVKPIDSQTPTPVNGCERMYDGESQDSLPSRMRQVGLPARTAPILSETACVETYVLLPMFYTHASFARLATASSKKQ